MADETGWRRCSACKNPIALGSRYWTCNVSTCNRKRTGLAFCSLTCWEVHLPGANHRQAWAVESTAPQSREVEAAPIGGAPRAREPRRILPAASPGGPPASEPGEILIVASRLKDYVRARSGYHTSDRVLAPLSDIVRRVCDQAIANARREGRMTVLDRDIPDAASHE